MTKKEEGARRRGRPPVAAEKRKRHTLSFRLTDEVKEALQVRAETNGRSLSEEVESILGVELFTDMNLHQRMGDNADQGLMESYNRQIDIINDCVILQNILSRLFAGLVSLSMRATSINIQSYIAAYIELYDVVRYGISDVEWKAIKARNSLVMDVILSKIDKDAGLSDMQKFEIEREFAKHHTEMHNLLHDILRDKNITVKYERPKDDQHPLEQP